MQRAGLALFGALFALLFGAVALGVGIGPGAALPRGAVAVVEGAPGGLETITRTEFTHELWVQALERGERAAPQPSDPGFDVFKREAMSKLIGVVWVEAEAIQMGLASTPREIREKLSAGEAKAIKELGLSQRDVDARMRWYLAGDKIQELLQERVPEPSAAEIYDYYEESPPAGKSLTGAKAEIAAMLELQKERELFNRVENGYRAKWRARTRCAAGFIVEECSNFPLFDHPITNPSACYEADPKEPPEGCQAPVVGSKPAQPGSVRWWRPEGERLVQRSVLPGGDGDFGEGSGE